jgi:hypothetical protein
VRTTLDIDDDILQAAKELAAGESTTAGKVLSRLARSALLNNLKSASLSKPLNASEPTSVYGFKPFASRGGIVTNELIDRLREEDGI